MKSIFHEIPDGPLPRAIFLDWDGTLVDSFSFLLSAHNHTRAIFGLEPFTAEKFMDYFGMPREVLYKNLYGKNRDQAKIHFEEFVVKHHLEYLMPLPGADRLVRTIRDLGILSGVVSNKKGIFVRKEIGNFGWESMFSAIVGAAEAPQDKPAADPLLLAISLAGAQLSPEICWFVGDSETDALCAYNAGSTLVLIDHGNNIGSWIESYPHTLIVKNCDELSDFLLQWHENQVKKEVIP